MAGSARARLRLGVLALQGGFVEHMRALAACGVEARPVRVPEDLRNVQGLILPGGESTALRRLMHRSGTDEAIRRLGQGGFPVYGTCAGLILMAREVEGPEGPCLSLIDIAVKRNAYGRQVASFEANIRIPALGEPELRGVFIRAPLITRVGPRVEVLAEHDGSPVLVRSGSALASTFHPELSGDTRVHRYFIEMARAAT